MRKREKIKQYMMLCISIVMLVLYILPHHHHHDGMACYSLTEMSESAPSHDNDSHSCDSTGHNLFIKNFFLNDDDADGTNLPHLITFITDLYGTSMTPLCLHLPFRLWQSIYLEKLKDQLLASSNGLRAPPHLLF